MSADGQESARYEKSWFVAQADTEYTGGASDLAHLGPFNGLGKLRQRNLSVQRLNP